MSARFAILCTTALLLGGCTVGPNFVPPKPDTPSTWSALTSQVTTKPVAAAAWWNSFDDPLLTSLTERATTSNLDVKTAVLRIAEARANRDIAAASAFPTLSANAAYERERISEETAFTSLLSSLSSGPTVGRPPAGGISGPIPHLQNPFGQWQAGFDASWELDLWGRVRRSVEAADADTEASIEDGRNVLVSLLAETGRDYIDLRAGQLRRSVLEENLRTQSDSLALARDRRRAGIGNDLDVANAAAEVSSTEALLPAEISRITQDINQLSFLLAEPPGALRAELQTEKPVPPVPPQVPIGLPADLVRRRPDIREAEAQLHAATARIGVSVSDLFPTITLSADVGSQAAEAGHLGTWASRFFTLGPSIDLPIFTGGEREATITLNTVKEKEAAVAYARAVLTALEEVENALVAYGAEASRRAALEATVTQNRDALALASYRYTSGVTTFLDVLEAERSLEQSELSLADSTAALSTDLVVLYKALGGGWQTTTAG